MRYADGRQVRVGDAVDIDGTYRGRVVACIDDGDYAAEYPPAQWSYLQRGVLVETDAGGLVHYGDSAVEGFELLHRID